MTDRDLQIELRRLLASGSRTEARILAHLAAVEERRLHLEAGSSSLFDYCCARLGLSENEAFHRITAARLARRFPSIFSLIERRTLHLTAVCLLRDYLTPENHRELLEAAAGKTKLQVLEMLARRFPRPDVASTIRKLPSPRAQVPALTPSPIAAAPITAQSAVAPPPTAAPPPESNATNGASVVSNDAPSPAQVASAAHSAPKAVVEPLSAARYRIQLNASAQLKQKLEHAVDLLSHSNPSGDLSLVIERALDLLIERVEKNALPRPSWVGGARLGKARPSMKEIGSVPANRLWARCAPIALAVCAACATVQSGPYATPVDPAGQPLKGNRTAAGLMLRGAEDPSYSSPNFGFIVVTFQNDTDDWVRVERVNVRFGGGAKDASVTIPAGEKLQSWAEAALQFRAIRNENAALILGALAVAGSTVALSANNRSARAAGASVSVAAEAGLAMSQAVGEAESFPPAHLLSVPFEIPPHLFSKRWIALQTPTSQGTPCVDAMLIDYQTARAQRERVWVRFFIGSWSEWQQQTCPRAPERTP